LYRPVLLRFEAHSVGELNLHGTHRCMT
jgi:hypothetical protein